MATWITFSDGTVRNYSKSNNYVFEVDWLAYSVEAVSFSELCSTIKLGCFPGYSEAIKSVINIAKKVNKKHPASIYLSELKQLLKKYNSQTRTWK